MVDYTWVANLLREIENYATENRLTCLSENIAVACAALISDTEDKADISPEARQWLVGVTSGQFVAVGSPKIDGINVPRC
jgi:hypothetical protein